MDINGLLKDSYLLDFYWISENLIVVYVKKLVSMGFMLCSYLILAKS